MAAKPDTEHGHNGQTRPTDRLREEFQNLMGAMGDRAVTSVKDKVGAVTERLSDYAEHGDGSGLASAVKGVRDLSAGKSPVRAALGMTGVTDKAKNLFGLGKGGNGGQGKTLKVTNIIESIDIGVPVEVVYNQWTQFTDFPGFTKKVERVEQESDEKLHWTAQILWSHRSWESTILQQVPDERIVWRSKGDKGYADGAVTFHELAPNLTRVILTLEYHPKGFFEHTGNLWRAPGRRVRLELKHFRRHVMTEVIMHPEEVEGWRGRIEEGQVVDGQERGQDEESGSRQAQARDEESGSRQAQARDEESGSRQAQARAGESGRQAQGSRSADARTAGGSGQGGKPAGKASVRTRTGAGSNANERPKSGGQTAAKQPQNSQGRSDGGGRAGSAGKSSSPVRRDSSVQGQQATRRPAGASGTRAGE